MTLGELEAKEVQILCWCNRCSHKASLAPGALAGQLGRLVPVPEVGVHMRCTGCGSKDIATRPDWPSKGPVARHG